jgi:hypothetical protein
VRLPNPRRLKFGSVRMISKRPRVPIRCLGRTKPFQQSGIVVGVAGIYVRVQGSGLVQLSTRGEKYAGGATKTGCDSEKQVRLVDKLRLLDHLVGASGQAGKHVEAEALAVLRLIVNSNLASFPFWAHHCRRLISR